MSKKIIIPKRIVTANNQREILINHAVEITDKRITAILDLKEFDLSKYDGDIQEFPALTLIPGFVQTHIHLCQTLFRGLADELELLDWLQQRIFPYENSHNQSSLKASARLGIHELLTSGTTTFMDMGTINYEEVIFEELLNSGIKAIAGKTMMDINDLYPEFVETTKDSLKRSYELAEEFHNSDNGRIKYGFAPRFVLSCTEELLKETKSMMQDFDGSIFHTHSSENKKEIEAVKRMHNKENIEYFESIDVLSDQTVLAHCIHVSDSEMALLKSSGTRVSHCPSSNLKLGSGIADIPRYMREGISVSLGADGAPCNNNLDVFTEMRLASLIQKPVYGPTVMKAEEVFRLATIEGAKALHLENEVGSVEIGKYADLVMLNLDIPTSNLLTEDEQVYSSIVYSVGKSSVKEVMVNGKWLVRDGESIDYDKDELYSTGKSELEKLIERAKVNS
ncbi:MAG: 5'-deoxyadenosine deaminase [Melioribacteraceae bacterium]|nr:5'-deoxyadenosine deaminase [Melioribacteraceae bacterium]MCF8356182.1 5'-deoxyadenosine deaminase [Melioribacteraceae bacterium]MCF8394753.1 5'-deoxyadenosine deaminase [Melioribacteraceae bacterium]MCF8417947.1 5'-deoxyadenosine deaminase [Melioribacteraceae bacterium]